MPERISALQKEVNALRAVTAELKETAVEHRLRLENGTKAFGETHDRVAVIEERIAPKPPSVYKIIGITITIFLACAGALWALSNMLSDRPTAEQIEKIVDKHDDVGHQSIRVDVGQIRVDQGSQKTLIEGIEREQTVQGVKLDTLLERVPKRGRNR